MLENLLSNFLFTRESLVVNCFLKRALCYKEIVRIIRINSKNNNCNYNFLNFVYEIYLYIKFKI